MQDTSQRTFTHVDFAAQPTEDQVKTKLFFQGIMGTFLGPTDSAFLVLESRKIGADNFAVYTSSSELTEESLLGYTYVQLDTGDCAVTVWPGPPACQMLKEAQYDPIDGSLIEEELVLGLGLALVGTAQGSLLLVLVPDVSEADTDQDLEACQVQCEMQLLESERVVQVSPPPLAAAVSHTVRPLITVAVGHHCWVSMYRRNGYSARVSSGPTVKGDEHSRLPIMRKQ